MAMTRDTLQGSQQWDWLPCPATVTTTRQGKAYSMDHDHCRHDQGSLWGRCMACGMTWAEQRQQMEAAVRRMDPAAWLVVFACLGIMVRTYASPATRAAALDTCHAVKQWVGGQ